ncbi:uncharacterized protein LOC108142265 isoform X4 [Drosophila elegans]|uniref:uncharacterized protein LOC108142265 isoform X4 n=1 Tax=Drosophila elegans TaxID=30023 RepID=UPI0007E6ACDD|nr:uncharacterized protein LOC108142265 isoform X4 [Drosophila elegans]
MCFCSTHGLKIALLIIIPIAAGFNAGQVAKDITLLDELTGHHHIVLIISITLCIIILFALLGAIYAAVRHHALILNVSLVLLVLKCIAKCIILIVCIATENNLEKTAAHFWFILCWIFTILCMLANLCFSIRLKELLRQTD